MLDGRGKSFHLSLMVFIMFFVGCASSFNPRPVDEVPFKERAQTQSEDGVTVTAAVLSAEESRAKFGVNLYSRNIQPIWLEIENNDDDPMRFLPIGSDPNYFTPLESCIATQPMLSLVTPAAARRRHHACRLESPS